MNIYFFLAIRALSLSDIDIRVHDRIQHLPMCGWKVRETAVPDPQAVSTYANRDALRKHADSVTGGDPFRNQKHFGSETGAPNQGVDNQPVDVQQDHVDRIAHIEYDKVYILTYMSPETAPKREAKINSNEVDTGSETVQGKKRSSLKTTDSTSTISGEPAKSVAPNETLFKTTGKYSNSASSRARTTRGNSLFRKRREAISKTKPTSQHLRCSCTISTANNFTIGIESVHGPSPTDTLMVLSGQKQTNLDVGGFWETENPYSVAVSWNQRERKTRMTVTIVEKEKPVHPYMIVLVVNERNVAQDPESISPFFVGAVTALSVALIVLIVVIALLRGPCKNLRKTRTKQKGPMAGQQGGFYEEIPDPNRTRSGSKPKLGTLSLSLPRGQNSPILIHNDRKKDSVDRTSILTTITTSSFNADVPDDQVGATSASPTPDYAVYEELPEVTRNPRPPPKPFLDRESLMIQRSQSTPIRYSFSSSSSDDDAGQPECNRRIKMSLSYSEDRSMRIDRDACGTLLKHYSFQQKSTTPKGVNVPPTTNNEATQQNGETAFSSQSDLDCDNNYDNNNNNDGEEEGDAIRDEGDCCCGNDRNDHDNTYSEIDSHPYRDVTGQKVKAEPCRGSSQPETMPQLKGRVVYRQDCGEEFVMFDNILYGHSNPMSISG